MRQRRISGKRGANVSFEAMRALARSLLALIVLGLHAAGETGKSGLRYAAFLSSRSARRRILPTLVFGSSLRNSTCLGRL